MTSTESTEPIHHLAMPDDWAAAVESGEYRMSTRGLTIDDVGFIHCSTREQLVDTADRFYGDVDQLVLVTIDQAAVGAPIRFEPPEPGSAVLFPHIYGPLTLAAVVEATVWTRGPAGWTLG